LGDVNLAKNLIYQFDKLQKSVKFNATNFRIAGNYLVWWGHHLPILNMLISYQRAVRQLKLPPMFIFMVAKYVATSQCIFLIGKQHLDLNATDGEGKTALHWSALYNRTNTVKVCIHATLYQ